MGEVSCVCFLFTVPILRGAGSGCLLTGLRRRGKGKTVQEGKTTRQPNGEQETERETARSSERRCKTYEKQRERERETVLPESSETRPVGRTKRAHKTTPVISETEQHWAALYKSYRRHQRYKKQHRKPTQNINLQRDLSFNWK